MSANGAAQAVALVVAAQHVAMPDEQVICDGCGFGFPELETCEHLQTRCEECGCCHHCKIERRYE